ncbi:hypothetical protein [uncultured Aquimarina sp.]|uniref:hypothetical protein n=1 Tax=uncultured Aquimarina sp. TaxID=575652 RepID=UPI0026248C5F|nr:hypothetical protein [uncultured Aquimarina sp.]
MLVNNTYRDPDLKKNLTKQVGKPFTIMQRIKLGGIGSPKLHITECSKEITNLLIADSSINTCNIELRPKGILVGFGVRLETYLLVIPFYKLTIYKEKTDEYCIYKDNYFIKFKAKNAETAIHNYIKKVLSYKANTSSTDIKDL